MPDNPQLLFVAGPNGAGKSTYSRDLSEPGAIIFDVDKVIARIEAQSPSMPKKNVYQAATEEFFNQATEAVRHKQHFTLETNFRDDQLSDIVAQFKQYGYTTNMVYLTLKVLNNPFPGWTKEFQMAGILSIRIKLAKFRKLRKFLRGHLGVHVFGYPVSK